MRDRTGTEQIKRLIYLAILACVCFSCYRQPVADDFDRYVYEAIVRGQSQDIRTVYNVVKHESPRSEGSSILDSPQHLQQLEPLYAIRPIYLKLISLLFSLGIPIQHAINLISALSLLGIGLLVLQWTNHPLGSTFLTMSAPILVLGRIGTPDGLSALVVICALLCVWRGYTLAALALLIVSIGIRTDNVIIGALAVVWIAWTRKIAWYVATLWLCVAVGLVVVINFQAASYGWITLFRWSFLSGARSPADVQPYLTVRDYLGIFARNARVIATRSAMWVLLGVAVWVKSKRFRPMLAIVALAVVLHFVLYPSDEDRYLIWAYLVAGIAFIRDVAFVVARRDDRDGIRSLGSPNAAEVESAIAS